jgi:hypothetical protein
MKILFDNKLLSATVIATNEDSNYPVSNLKSPFLRRKFQSTGTSSTITATISTTINSIFYGYTNGSVTVRLYNGGLVATYSGIGPSKHFADTVITKIEVDISSASTVYLGGLGIGQSVALDPPESFWDETFDDRSIVSESQTGQVLQEYVEPLRNYDFSIPTINRDDLRALQTTYLAYGRGHILWIDPETDDLPVMYGRMTEALSASKNRKLYTAQLKFKEAR